MVYTFILLGHKTSEMLEINTFFRNVRNRLPLDAVSYTRTRVL